jgi:type I restriction enzyme M protein
MYVRLHLKNWRSIEDATVEFAPFTVIVGKNSSGKSNLVDALLFSSEVARDAETAVSRRGGIASIRRWSPSKRYDITIGVRLASSRKAFSSDYTSYELVLRSGKQGDWRFDEETLEYVVKGVRRRRFLRTQHRLLLEHDDGSELRGGSSDFSSDLVSLSVQVADTTSAMLYARQLVPDERRPRLGEVGELPSVRVLRPVPDIMRQPQPPSESPSLADNGENITSALYRMKRSQRTEVVRAMQRIIPGLADVEAQPAGRYFTLVFRQNHGANRQADFTATEMSDGALRALAVIVAAQQMQTNELLVVEEPEISLHPGAADVIYDVLHRASKHGTVLITTHSPEILDRAKDDEILVCEYVKGVTKIGPLAESQRALVRQGLFSAAELMRSEELRREGAEPRVVQGA